MFQYIVDRILCEKGYTKLHVSKKLVICRTSFLHYVKVTHFVLWCLGSSCMFCFCGCDSGFSRRFVLCLFCCCGCDSGFLTRFVLCSLFCTMFFIMFFSVCFYIFVIGDVCNQFSRYLIPELHKEIYYLDVNNTPQRQKIRIFNIQETYTDWYYRKMNITQTYLRNHCQNHKNKTCMKTRSTTK
jgi:hypothetical protein